MTRQYSLAATVVRPNERTIFGNIKVFSLDAIERTLLQVQAKQLNTFNTVFVVYGSGHLFLELRQHQEWFGGVREGRGIAPYAP